VAVVIRPAGTTRCQFTTAAPRHFIYPALLLLLAEEPRHGYRLVDAALRLGFGPFDRPSIYRALSELESDGLLRSWSASPAAGSTRHVYAVTEQGHGALAAWMEVVENERDLLSAVLKRYDATLDRTSAGADSSGPDDADDGADPGGR
jgi:DNA-binding PadR family transcriptional regulator